jgi:hypothetical protein
MRGRNLKGEGNMNEFLKKWYDKGFLQTDEMLCYEHIKQLEAIATNIGKLADVFGRIAEHGIPRSYSQSFGIKFGEANPENVAAATEAIARCNETRSAS